jgi:transcriptional regulator with XRE-family HTH domain
MICPKCDGTGNIPDPGEMRRVRMSRGFLLREVARRMHISPAYLSDLERGKRDWNAKRLREFVDAIY